MKARLCQYLESVIVSMSAPWVAHFEATQLMVERARDPKHGHFSSNIALILAKKAGCSPRELAQSMTDALLINQPADIDKVEIAGPGFINFTLTAEAFTAIVRDSLKAPERVGRLDLGKGKKVYLEYVSANPTGPLHVGHGRGAAFGASLANVLTATGHVVQRTYYVNDAGRQMQILALSVWLRYLQAQGLAVYFPSNGYQGEYVQEISAQLTVTQGDAFAGLDDAALASFCEPSAEDADLEARMDTLIELMREAIGLDAFAQIQALATETICQDIRQDLGEFGVDFDAWIPESGLLESGALETAIETLIAAGHTYEHDGALWFKSSELGDDKDRVLMRANGWPTYFATDIANHFHNFQQGITDYIDVFGADHHGYVPRVRAAMHALGCDVDRYTVLLVQFAILYRGQTKVSMSTRSGQFVSLRELREEVGNDAARFFYVMRKPEQHLDFDLELAKSQTNENPVFYVQYAGARVSSVFRQLEAAGRSFDQAGGLANLSRLDLEQEHAILRTLSQFSECLESAATQRAPHLIAHFLQHAAGEFHTYYNAVKFIVDDEGLCQARLCLILALRLMIESGLKLLGVSAPERM